MKRRRIKKTAYLKKFMTIIIFVLVIIIGVKIFSSLINLCGKPFFNAITSVCILIKNPNAYMEMKSSEYVYCDKELPLEKEQASTITNENISSSMAEEIIAEKDIIENAVESKKPINNDEPDDVLASLRLKAKIKPSEIPSEYRGKLVKQVYSGANNPCFFPLEYGYVRNYTELKNEEIEKILSKPFQMKIGDNSEPQVLIFHTHATESFESYDSDFYDTRGAWRSTDNNKNMVAVGNIFAEELKKQGINVIHDYEQHDYPSYNGSYARSCKTVESYLKKYPSIKIILDLHRDAVEKDGNIIMKTDAHIKGDRCSQIMVISGYDNGELNMPNWDKNFRLAVEMTQAMEKEYKGITRPLYLCDARYNMHLSQGLLLMEIGTHGNTLEESQITAYYAGKALGKLFKTYME